MPSGPRNSPKSHAFSEHPPVPTSSPSVWAKRDPLDTARDLFGLTDAELEKLAADPEQMLVIADIVAES